MTFPSDEQLLAQAYDVIMFFCADERWKNTGIGNLAEQLAKRLNEQPPYLETE